MKVAFVSTWDRVCGIADYSKELWPAINKTLIERGDEGVLISLDQFKSEDELINELKAHSPDLIHFQHEYSFFGGKIPPLYTFPRLIARIKAILPKTRLLATAHTVIPDNYTFPLLGRGWQIPVRTFANLIFLKKLKAYWSLQTWGPLNGTIIHSKRQLETMRKSGVPYAEVVPLFVPIKEKILEKPNRTIKNVLVFGFFTSEKGQDIAIEAFKFLKVNPQIHLILAGGLRKKSDSYYFDLCKEKIKSLNLSDRITITGYLDSAELKKYFDQADLVVVPFRATSGSASLTQVLAWGLPVLASDLPLNLEIEEREPGVLKFFKTEDPKDLAEKIDGLIFDNEKLNSLRQGTLRYAVSMAPNRVALQHLVVYDNLVK